MGNHFRRPKTGITSLSYYLRQHPELEVSREELHFFDNEKINWESPNYKDCENKFRTPNKIKIDHTPIYMFLNPCCARIHRYNPDMKIIVILRNLTDRSYSQWAMEHNRGRETLSFAQALQRKINATAYSNNKQHRVHSYIKRGMYSNQIKRLWNYFGKENVFVARHEDLKEKTQEIVQSICDHIGVKTNHKFDETKQRIGKYPPKNVTEELINLQKIFHHEVTELEKPLDWDCNNRSSPAGA